MLARLKYKSFPIGWQKARPTPSSTIQANKHTTKSFICNDEKGDFTARIKPHRTHTADISLASNASTPSSNERHKNVMMKIHSSVGNSKGAN